MSELVASIVVSTRNRCALLARALDALLQQAVDDSSYEIVVVDNNSTDATPAVIREYASRSRGRVKYVAEARAGVSHGRNRGIAASRGELVGFTDDDVLVTPEWLSSAIDFLRAHSGVEYVGGPVFPIWPELPPVWLTRQHWAPVAAVDYGDAAFEVPRDRAVCLITANLVIRRRALDRVGWFNPNFRRCQDRELMLRLWQSQLRGAYNPRMIAHTMVSPERLRRAYHRRWHATHGEFLAQMPMRERRSASGWLVEPSSNGRFFCGVPLFEYRELLVHSARWLAAFTLGQREAAFAQELRVRYALAFVQSAVACWIEGAIVRRHRV